MGMFDSVYINCPNCGNDIEFQSKSGACELRRYHHSSVPADIAMDIHGNTECCSVCLNAVTLQMPSPDCRVSMVLGVNGNWD